VVEIYRLTVKVLLQSFKLTWLPVALKQKAAEDSTNCYWYESGQPIAFRIDGPPPFTCWAWTLVYVLPAMRSIGRLLSNSSNTYFNLVVGSFMFADRR